MSPRGRPYRWLWGGLLLLASSTLLGKNSESRLKVGLIEFNPLIAFDPKRPVGPLFDYAQPILEGAGQRVIYQQLSIERSLEQLKQGQLDLVLTLFKTPERQLYVRFSKFPLLTVNSGFCMEKDIEKHPLTTSSRLGHFRGTVVPEVLQTLDLYPVTGDRMQERMLQMLRKGRVDAVFSPKPEVFILTARLGKTRPPQYCYEIRDSRVPIYLGFSKALAPAIVQRLEDSLKNRIESEDFDRYLARRLKNLGMEKPVVIPIDGDRLPTRARSVNHDLRHEP